MMMYPLTIPQENIWNLQKFYSDSSISNISGLLVFDKRKNLDLLKEAVNVFIRNQDGIRMRFMEKGSEVCQYVSAFEVADIPAFHFKNLDEAETFFEEEGRKPFLLTDSAMYRFYVFDTLSQSGICPCLNHLVADAWTLSLFCEKVIAYYDLLEQGLEAGIETVSYLDHIRAEEKYVRSQRYVKDDCYWKHRFLKKPDISHIRPAGAVSKSVRAYRLTRTISSDLAGQMREWCTEHNISLAVILEAAVFAYLYRINDHAGKIFIGVPVLNRAACREKETAGMFISTIPFGITLSGEETATLLCEKIAVSHREIFRHQKYPYSNMLTYIRETFGPVGNLYDVMVSYQNAKIECSADSGFYTKWLHNGYSEIPLALHMDDRDGRGILTINMDYQAEVFSDREAELLYDRLCFILSQFVVNEQITVDGLQIMPENEYRRVVYDFNDTAVHYPKHKCVHELFGELTASCPDKTALIFEDQQFTYRQLDEMSNSLGHYLRNAGVKPNDIVPIIAKRNWRIFVAMLAVLKAGGAYMFVDPAYPLKRIEYMINISCSDIALLYGYEGICKIRSMQLDKFDYEYDARYITNVNKSDDLCYVIFTSGSTGSPKGISISHRNVINLCDDNNNNLCHKILKSSCQGVISVTNIIFDIFVTESILPLLNGICIYFTNDHESISQSEIARIILTNNIEVLETTPAKMRSYILDKKNASYLSMLKVIILGGEPLPVDLLTELKRYTDAGIFNLYGPAETTVWVTTKKAKDKEITIGKPIANTQIYILDKNRQPLPIGIAGELCISGDGVGKGYLNRQELTAEKFVPNPFLPGKTMYCSGDLARWRADGELEFLGRMDTQVKIRGLRIELGEIESAMNAFGGISISAVADKKDDHGRQYLAGYYVSENSIEEKMLRSSLLEKLPQYMVPNYFIRLEQMPMTASGKIDRKNLPDPVFADSVLEYEEPVTDSEKILAGIWENILHCGRAGRNYNFYDCGGDSLCAIHMLAAVEEKFGIHMEMKLIVEHPVLSDLAACIDESGMEKAEVIPVLHRLEYVLTPQQTALYLACQRDKESLVYNMPVFIPLAKDADIEKIKERIQYVYRSHPALRTAVALKGEEITGIIDEHAPLIFEDFEKKEEFLRPFDLTKAPLMRAGFGCGGLALDFHHIVADGESLYRLLDEIFHGVQPSEKAGYADYAAYFKNRLADGGFDRHKEYFKNLLHTDIEPVELPEHKHTGSRAAGAGSTYILRRETVNIVKNFAVSNNLTETCVYLAVYGMLLADYTNKRQIVSGIILSNRTHAQMKDVCGMFVNTVPLVQNLDADAGFLEYADRLNKTLLELYQYQELLFLEICKAAGIADRNVVNTVFIYQPWERGSGGMEWEYMDTGTYKFDLSFQAVPQADECCKIMMEYNAGKYDSTLMRRLAAGFERLICQIAADRKLKDFSVLSKEEYQLVVYGFNDTASGYQTQKCVHELLQQKFAEYADRTALVFRGQAYTYKQLDEMSNALAHALREAGVGPGDIVPVITRRSWHIAAAMLGVLKAGGAFMPADPDYPQERIAYMIREAGSRLALTYGFHRELPVKAIDLGTFDYSSHTAPLCNVNAPEDTCYVIFTSGSTGMPKGVMLKHSGLVNFASPENVFHREVFHNCSCGLAVGSYAFDISITEIYLPLLSGRKIVMADEDTVNSPGLLADAVSRYGIDLLHTTPTRLAYYLEHEKFRNAASGLKVILSAGEAFSRELFHRLRSVTDAKIFNGYGPTETTVGCSFVEVTQPDDITIGSPVPNTRIYVLNQCGQPCPVGVAGELCIAGAGVGKGYLNRTALTEEKFVLDPFVRGGRMYKSGDLACWRADGRLKYLGRMDTQVKIRGLRIELGEIENQMRLYDGIQMSAAADRRDKNGRQYLAGYYTSSKPVDEKCLREHLLKKLPKYMVPNYFMRLKEIPVTVSGKTDRKRLPEPERQAVDVEGYTAPRSRVEQILCEIMAEVLGYEKTGITDDFFEHGGDSLKAMEFAVQASDRGITFGLQAVFEHPTVEGLAGHIERNRDFAVEYFASDFEKYREILRKGKGSRYPGMQYRQLGDVFLTGATGFLGVHILDSLMKRDAGRIYCLVRADSMEGAQERLLQTLRYYFGKKYDVEMGRRIIPAAGDITDSEFSGKVQRGHGMESVRTVIHAAATVKHFGDYSSFDAVNVRGTQQVLCLAKNLGAKFVLISTVSVGGLVLNEKGSGNVLFDESSLYIGQNLDNVYLKSKFEAECLVLDAVLKGQNCMICRVGNLTNRYTDAKFQRNYEENAFLQRMKTFVDLQAYPSALALEQVEFSPVDFTAEAVVRMAGCEGSTVFHVNNPKCITYGMLADMFSDAGYKMEAADTEQFLAMLHGDTDSAYDSVKNEWNGRKSMEEHAGVLCDSSFTERVLRENGFEWCAVTQEYIDKYAGYFNGLHYWKTDK